MAQPGRRQRPSCSSQIHRSSLPCHAGRLTVRRLRSWICKRDDRGRFCSYRHRGAQRRKCSPKISTRSIPDGPLTVSKWSLVVLPSEKATIQLLDLNSKQVSIIPGSQGLFSPRWSTRWSVPRRAHRRPKEDCDFRFQKTDMVRLGQRDLDCSATLHGREMGNISISRYQGRKRRDITESSWTDSP